jgi:alpha-maltose-1-phosphate synthase
MKIAFIRGPFLNPWEFQSYLPLSRRHQVTAVGADWSLYPIDAVASAVTVRRPPLWAGASARFYKDLPTVLNRLRSWTLGESYALENLQEAVEDAEILHPAELYSTMTYQCAELKKKLGRRLVVTVWENLAHMGETHPRRKQRKQEAIAAADRILAVTETSKTMLQQEGVPSEKIHVIPMAVDLQHFQPQPRDRQLAREWGIGEKDQVILFVGRFVEEKGIRDLLQVIPALLSPHRSERLRFVFVGEGPLREDLLQARKQHGDAVVISSFRGYHDIPRIHNLADIFVLPSKAKAKWQEQFGYVLAESMACGKPVVTTRSGSIPDVVGDAAILVEPGRPEALAEGLRQMLDPSTRTLYAGRALKRAREQFDAERVSLQIEQMYQQALRAPCS